jgi:hypothetical protein
MTVPQPGGAPRQPAPALWPVQHATPACRTASRSGVSIC